MSIVFFDIDGTFLSEVTHQIPESAVKGLRELQRNGHLAFINTGRTLRGIPDEIISCGFDGYVCGCGTHIYYREKRLLEHKIPADLCIEMVEKLREMKQPVFYEDEDAIYFEKHYEIENEGIVKAREILEPRGITKYLPEDIRNHPVLFDKVFIHMPHNGYEAETRTYLEERFHCIDRGNNAVEVTQRGFTKATGIRFLCEYLDTDIRDCYAFGDSMNDFEMLREAGHAAAMGVCDERILPYCEYRTAKVEEDGIYQGLKHFGLI